MAVSRAGANPPTRATTTTAIRYISTSLVRLRSPRKLARNTVSTGSSAAASTYPATFRRLVIAPRGLGRPRPRPICAWVTMCTSMSPEPRMVRALMPGPVSMAVSHDRRLAPSTSWVAFSARAKVSRASEMLSPTTWW